MEKPVPDKLNPGHDAAVRRMLASAPHLPARGTPPGRSRSPKIGKAMRLRKGPRPQPPSHSLVHRA